MKGWTIRERVAPQISNETQGPGLLKYTRNHKCCQIYKDQNLKDCNFNMMHIKNDWQQNLSSIHEQNKRRDQKRGLKRGKSREQVQSCKETAVETESEETSVTERGEEETYREEEREGWEITAEEEKS